MIIDAQIKRLLHGCAGMNAVRMMTGSFHVFYLVSLGVSVSQIALLQMVFSVAVFLFELPTGILGDKLGVKKNVLISCFFYATFFPLCTYAPNMTLLFLAEICYALGACFISGADSTWIKGLVDGLPEKNDGSYHHYISYVREVNALLTSISGVIGVLIVIILNDFTSVYYLCGILFFMLMLVFSTINGVDDKVDVAVIKEKFSAYKHMSESIHHLFSTRVGYYYIIVCGFIVGAIQPVFHFWQPFILGQTELLDDKNQKGEIIILGICFFLYSFTKYLFNRYLRKVIFKYYQPMTIILATTILAACSMLALLIVKGSWTPVVIFALFHSFFSVPMSQFESEYFKYLDKKNSNTVLSIISLMARIFGIISLGIIGLLSDNFGLTSVFAFSFVCIAGIVPITIMWMSYNSKLSQSEEIALEEIK
ncbi:MFS transporter [Pantoea cypripedii]|uniref:MFS transporter n=1 Tax=Pantoea cypripedii TaxID=55209 RepID=A0A6B9G4I7_PANCY|nr:MFS transporter [Pantoea cypripedii]QGY30393.1 MFS transporter [Pantoea cypripedii]